HVRRDGHGRLFDRHVPPVHPRLLQGLAVPRLRLRDHRHAPRAGHPQHGGLKDKIPFTYWTIVIGTLALTGFPLTAGYFSKDAIIEAAYVSHNPMALYAYGSTAITAALTAFYSWRLIFKTFHGSPHDRHHYEAAHESPWVM